MQVGPTLLSLLLCVCLIWTVKGITPGEALALQKIIESSNGNVLPSQWIASDTASACTWPGITCGGSQIVERITLAQFNGSLPTQVRKTGDN